MKESLCYKPVYEQWTLARKNDVISISRKCFCALGLSLGLEEIV